MKGLINCLLVVSALFIWPQQSNAQWNEKKYWEYGALFGGAGYMGEFTEGVANSEDWNAMAGFIMKYHFDRKIAFRFGLSAGTISGNDENSSYIWRRNRNLNFRSRVYEAYIAPEMHFFTGPAFTKGVHPYVSAGLGFAYFEPQTYFNNQWINLRPLGTEGQGLDVVGSIEKYNPYTLTFPIGLGVQFHAGNSWFIGIELNYRYTLTDYLDDVSGYYPDPSAMSIRYGAESMNVQLSDRRIDAEQYSGTFEFYPLQQRGNPSDKDRYFLFGISLTKKLIGVPCNAF